MVGGWQKLREHGLAAGLQVAGQAGLQRAEAAGKRGSVEMEAAQAKGVVEATRGSGEGVGLSEGVEGSVGVSGFFCWFFLFFWVKGGAKDGSGNRMEGCNGLNTVRDNASAFVTEDFFSRMVLDNSGRRLDTT